MLASILVTATHPLLEGLSLRDLRIDKASPARLDAGHPGIRRQAGNTAGDVGPGPPVVPRNLQIAVISTGPDDTGLDWRIGQRHDRAMVLGPRVVSRQPTGFTLSQAGMVVHHHRLREDGWRWKQAINAVGAVTTALCALDPGSLVWVRGPYGNEWPLAEAVGTDLVVVAGGIGLAPLRPAVRHALANRDDYGAVSVLVGARPAAEADPGAASSSSPQGREMRLPGIRRCATRSAGASSFSTSPRGRSSPACRSS